MMYEELRAATRATLSHLILRKQPGWEHQAETILLESSERAPRNDTLRGAELVRPDTPGKQENDAQKTPRTDTRGVEGAEEGSHS